MKKKYQIALVTIGCLIGLLGLSYAYFIANSSGGGVGDTVTVKTVNLDEVGFQIEGELEFEDLDILPGHKNISKIKATAVGSNDTINYKLVWEGTNTLNTPLKYYVYKTTTSETPSITCEKQIEKLGSKKIYYETCTNNNFDNLGTIISTGEISNTEISKEFILKDDEVIKGTKEGNSVYYYVVLEYPNLDESQNIDMGGSFDGMVTVKKVENTLADITIKKIYQETNTGYQEINRMPEGYVLNSTQSTCTNNATPTAKGNKILITNLTTSGTECNIYFDKDREIPIITNVSTTMTETEITINVTAEDNIGVKEYWYSIDNNEPVKGTSNSYKFIGLEASTSHTIKVYVKDAAGNQSETYTGTVITLDTTKPEITNVTSSVTMTDINVTVEATDNVGVTEYWYKIDNGTYTKGTGNTYKFTGLGVNSSHTVSVYVKDAAGNQSETSSNIIITAADTAKPTISNITTSATETDISVTVTATDNVGVTEYWYAIDSGSFTKATTNTHKFTGLKAGSTHTVKVYVKDAAGNQSTTTTKSVTTEKAPTAGETILDNITVKTTTPTFTTAATTNEGVFKVADGMYGGTSYYWRGAVTNNYVKFGEFCWRIIRINGDGSIRLIYDGTTCHTNGTSTAESIAKTSTSYNSSYNNSSYVGWTYTVSSQRPSGSGTSSNAKIQLELWYNTNLASYASKIADGKYCNDRNVASGSTWSATGSRFDYAAYNRINTGAPTLSCPTEDVYTLKVGLITADEVMYAGGKFTNNTSYYLYNGQNYWTMSPLYWTGGYAWVFYVNLNGYLNLDYSVSHTGVGLRPVINLKSDVAISSGTGTQSDPYVVQ